MQAPLDRIYLPGDEEDIAPYFGDLDRRRD